MGIFSECPIFRISICCFLIFKSEMGSPRVGRCLKIFLEVVRFVVAEYRAVGSHGDPIRDQNCGLGNIWETSGGIWDASGGIWEASGGIWGTSGGHMGDIWRSYGGHLGDLGPQGDPKGDLRVRAFKSVTPLG